MHAAVVIKSKGLSTVDNLWKHDRETWLLYFLTTIVKSQPVLPTSYSLLINRCGVGQYKSSHHVGLGK